MENLFHLFIQALITASVFCGFVYFGIPRAALSAQGKWLLYAKLIGVFIGARILLEISLQATGDPSKDWLPSLIGPLVAAYLAGRIFTRPGR